MSEKLPLSDKVDFFSTDYQNVPIPKNSVIYCDIPYKDTGKYQRHKKVEFDYDRFYEWAEKQEQPIFISEYWMPEDRFTCIAEIKRTSSFSQTNNSLLALEKVFVPKNQHSKITTNSQFTLFDWV